MVRLFKVATSLAAVFGAIPLTLAGDTPSFTHDIDGAKFLTSGPTVAAPLHSYWYATSKQALHTLKKLLGPDGLKDLLKPEIAAADTYWHDVVDRSTTKNHGTVASGRTVAYLPNVTAVQFVKWFSSPLADAANNDANAEHYFKETTADPKTQALSSEIIEGWGGVTTHFKIPSFAPANRTVYPFLDPLEDRKFPVQFAGDKVLLDGTVFGVLHIAVRDVLPGDFPENEPACGTKGIEIYAAVHYGDAMEEEHLETERQHMIIEEIHLALQAHQDIVDGRFPPN